MSSEKVLITSALLYANGKIHFGHLAGAYLPADIYARFQRLLGKDVLYLSGSDEYGVAILLSAQLAGRTPKEQVDLFHEVNQRIFQRLEFSFDHYSRTTWPGHVSTVQDYFTDLYAKGLITSELSLQLYSPTENQFLADRYVEGHCPKCHYFPARGDECPSCAASYEATDLKDPISKVSKEKLIPKETKHWFLRLDLLKDQLKQWISTRSWKSNVLNFIDNYIEDLRPRAITRDLNWGIPIPLDTSHGTEGKVLYVWFDAPIGYISAAKEWATLKGTPEAWKHFWLEGDDPTSTSRLVHFIGKDNIPFHGVIFPAMTLGQNQPYKLVDDLPANEFYLLEGRQFSKSDGWYIDIEEFLDQFSTDQLRYMIAATAPESSDSEFTWKEFQKRCNSDLLGKLGNFANRVLTFIQNSLQAKTPSLDPEYSPALDFISKTTSLMQQIHHAYSSYQVRRATQLIMELAQEGNSFFDRGRPWELNKKLKSDTLQREERIELERTLHSILAGCLEALKFLALAISPITPSLAQKLWSLLGFQGDLAQLHWNSVLTSPIPEGYPLPPPTLLTRKVEDEEIQAQIQKLYNSLQETSKKTNTRLPSQNNMEQQTPSQSALAQSSAPIQPFKPTITFDQLELIDLRVGKILAAELLPKSKKLLKLQVDLGTERGGGVRTILSGIRAHYSPEDVIGKSVVVVANLAPATIMGVESQGMILAAGDSDAFELLTVDTISAGSVIK
jgi:methionyl-tRNA synthetase